MIDSNLVQTTEKEVLIIQGSEKETILIESKSGPSGLSFLSGHGSPPALLGESGETYLDIDSGIVYKKSANVWTAEGSLIGPTGQSSFRTEIFILTTSDLLAKEITLSNTPVNITKTTVEIQHAPTQAYGIDFVVIGNKVNWSGLSFELLFEVGTIIIVRYYIT